MHIHRYRFHRCGHAFISRREDLHTAATPKLWTSVCPVTSESLIGQTHRMGGEHIGTAGGGLERRGWWRRDRDWKERMERGTEDEKHGNKSLRKERSEEALTQEFLQV